MLDYSRGIQKKGSAYLVGKEGIAGARVHSTGEGEKTENCVGRFEVGVSLFQCSY